MPRLLLAVLLPLIASAQDPAIDLTALGRDVVASPTLRAHAIDRLALADQAAASRACEAWLRGGDAWLRVAVVEIARRRLAPRPLDRLARLVEDPDFRVRRAMVALLADARSDPPASAARAALAQLVRLAGDVDARVAYAAVDALGACPDAAATEGLIVAGGEAPKCAAARAVELLIARAAPKLAAIYAKRLADAARTGERVWLTRKGAVSARAGELGIIPGSMGARSYIVRGKGSTHAFHSCSHGAGRAMSRGEAKRRFTVDDHAQATAAVECRKDEGVIDETPMAYKDIDAVMAAQADLVEVVHALKQVVCVKG